MNGQFVKSIFPVGILNLFAVLFSYTSVEDVLRIATLVATFVYTLILIFKELRNGKHSKTER